MRSRNVVENDIDTWKVTQGCKDLQRLWWQYNNKICIPFLYTNLLLLHSMFLLGFYAVRNIFQCGFHTYYLWSSISLWMLPKITQKYLYYNISNSGMPLKFVCSELKPHHVSVYGVLIPSPFAWPMFATVLQWNLQCILFTNTAIRFH